MIKKLLLRLTALSLLVLSTNNLWAIDYTQDANCQVAYLMLEGSGTSVADSSQNSNTLDDFKANGEPAWGSTTPNPPDTYVPYYLEYDGDNDYAIADNHTSFEFAPTESFTILAWIYMVDNDNVHRFVSKLVYVFLLHGERSVVCLL